MFGSTSLRLAALYTALFSTAVVVLGAITLSSTRSALSDQFDARIRVEAQALVQEYRIEGLEGVLGAVRERDRLPGALDYGIEGPGGEALAGRLAGVGAPSGWSVVQSEHPGQAPEPVRVLSTPLGDGRRLLVGDDLERISDLDGVVLRGFSWAFAGVLLLGVVGGYALSRGMQARIDAISRTAEAIIDGDLTRRVPVRGSVDDLDRLATTFNRMLDRIAALMESLRQVSTDIAHDLRTPLTRLRQRLESNLSAAEFDRDGTEAILAEMDAILDTFAALLRIAQIEGGARRAGFMPVDLAAVATTVVEAFAPSAEDVRRRLTLGHAEPALVEGDPELLTQMLVNLVENALRHTPLGASVSIDASAALGKVVLSVTDDGPGVPADEREKIFQRFYRLEASRSTPGSGLGLALVAAVARLHDAHLEMSDAAPGLCVKVTFAAAPAAKTAPT